jgi:hypothetical protein
MVEELVDGPANTTAERRAFADAEIGAAFDDRKLFRAAKPFTPHACVCWTAVRQQCFGRYDWIRHVRPFSWIEQCYVR